MITKMTQPALPGQKGLVLLSGGLDSATVMVASRNRGWHLEAIGFQYGQKHGCYEREAARRITVEYNVPFFQLDIPIISGSSLTDAYSDIPKNRMPFDISNGIPSTYVPARNLIMLSHALSWAENRDIYHIFIGANILDYSGYPDCRPEFLESFERTANLATAIATQKNGHQTHIHAPLLHKTKAEIIRMAYGEGLDAARKTMSCYSPRGSIGGIVACGICDSCLLRKKGFQEAGIIDETLYEVEKV